MNLNTFFSDKTKYPNILLDCVLFSVLNYLPINLLSHGIKI